MEKDRLARAVEAVKEIAENLGFSVNIKRDGENFEFIFDRDLNEEEPGKVTAVKNILKAKFPDHKIVEVEEAEGEE